MTKSRLKFKAALKVHAVQKKIMFCFWRLCLAAELVQELKNCYEIKRFLASPDDLGWLIKTTGSLNI